MLSKLIIAWCLMALCVVIHATGLTAAFTWMKGKSAAIEGRFWLATGTLICVVSWTVLMHLLQIAVWAFFYAWKHGMHFLAGISMRDCLLGMGLTESKRCWPIGILDLGATLTGLLHQRAIAVLIQRPMFKQSS